MKLALLVYLASISEKVSFIFGFLSITIAVLVVIAIVFSPLLVSESDFFKFKVSSAYGLSEEGAKKHNESVISNRKYVKKWSIIIIISGFVFSLISSLIPSEKTIYIMAGAYATEQIAKNERVQKIGSDVLGVIEEKLSKMKEDK